MRLSMLQQEAGKFEEQVQIVNQQISELEILKTGLENIEKAGDEILAPIGKGIYIKSKPLEKELFVNVGNGIVLKKKPADARALIDKQVGELNKLKSQLLGEIEQINAELQDLVIEAQKEAQKEQTKDK